MADVELSTGVVHLLNDVETLRRSLRMYPESHPALEPARERIRVRAAEVAGDATESTLGLAPEKLFWNGEEIELAPAYPAARLVQFLFHLGIAAIRLAFPQAGEGLASLASKLATLHDPPGEAERRQIMEDSSAMPGLELVPIDLSSAQFSQTEGEKSRMGSRMILVELAKRLSRDGAFPLAGKIHEGELTPGLVAEMLSSASDPEMLFDHLFVSLKEVVGSASDTRRSPVLDEVRDFLVDLLRLLDPDRATLAVAVALRHLPVAGDEDRTPWVAAELLLDAVEFMLINQHPIPPVVHRALHRLAAPMTEQNPPLADDLTARARQLLAQIPATDDAFVTPAPAAAASPDWDGATWVGDLAASLAEDQVRTHVVRILGETITLWPGELVADRAAVRLAEEFANALEIGDLRTARHVSGMLAATRSDDARRLVYETGVPAVVRAFGTFDREVHADLTAILVSLGEGALPTILQAMAEEESLAVRKRLLEVVARHGERAKPHLRRLLDDSRWYVVRNAVFLLRRLGDREIVPVLKARLATSPPQVLAEVLKTLVASEDPQWFAVLMRALDSEDEERRRVALEVASRIANPHVVRSLVQRLQSRVGMRLRDSFSVALIQALGRLRDPQAVAPLREILALKQWRFPFPLKSVRREAAVALASLDGTEARRLALALTSDRDPEVAQAVREALHKQPEREEIE